MRSCQIKAATRIAHCHGDSPLGNAQASATVQAGRRDNAICPAGLVQGSRGIQYPVAGDPIAWFLSQVVRAASTVNPSPQCARSSRAHIGSWGVGAVMQARILAVSADGGVAGAISGLSILDRLSRLDPAGDPHILPLGTLHGSIGPDPVGRYVYPKWAGGKPGEQARRISRLGTKGYDRSGGRLAGSIQNRKPGILAGGQASPNATSTL